MTNDSFSSQTWAIFIPKRNSEFKSIVWPAGPPQVRSQNQGFSQYLIKIEENIGISQNLGMIFQLFGSRLFSVNFCVTKVSKTVINMVLNTFESQAIWIEGMSFRQILKYFQYPLFWLLSWGSPKGHTFDLNPEFLLGTKSPMSGNKMSHWSSVFVEYKSLKEAPTKSHFSWDTL